MDNHFHFVVNLHRCSSCHRYPIQLAKTLHEKLQVTSYGELKLSRLDGQRKQQLQPYKDAVITQLEDKQRSHNLFLKFQTF